MAGMPKYFPVSPLIWRDRDFRKLDDHLQKAAFYILTAPHRNLEGLFYLPIEYAALDTGWTVEVADERLDELVEQRFILRDREADVVLIRNALKYQAPATRPQVLGAMKVLADLPENDLMDAFWDLCREFAPKLFESHTHGIAVAFPPKDESA